LSDNGVEADAADATPVQTLFLVIVDMEGQSKVVLEPSAQFLAQRQATPKDVYPALANVLADWQAIKTAEAVVSFQAQMARQAAGVAAADRIRQQLEQDHR
jgi:hypothetical protein